MTDNRTPYPVRVDASPEPDPVSRWLWLVKWVLLVPHILVLLFLWLAFYVVGIIAFFAILITARYPQALFDFNVGVLRWSWRGPPHRHGGVGGGRPPPVPPPEGADKPPAPD